MSLAQVIAPAPTPSGFLEWTFWHDADHDEIRQAIFTKYGIDLPVIILVDATEKVTPDWLRRHQEAHSYFTSVLDIAGSDLEGVDFRDERQAQAWFDLQFQEHREARAVLGI